MSVLDGVRVGDFTLHSGDSSPVLYDVVAMLAKQVDRDYIMRVLKDKAASESAPEWIVGIEFGGALLALGLAQAFACKFAVVRKDGTTTLPPSGTLPPARRTDHDVRPRIWLVDDVITRGTSTEAAKRVVDAAGYQVQRSICLVDRRAEMEARTCHAGSDGDCSWKQCPQTFDGEPADTGRRCPLDRDDPER